MEILHSKLSLIIFNLIINQQNTYKIEKTYVQEQPLFSKCPNLLDRQVGQKIEYLSKLIFVHTKVLGRQGRPSLDICPNFRSFILWDPSLSTARQGSKAPGREGVMLIPAISVSILWFSCYIICRSEKQHWDNFLLKISSQYHPMTQL